MYHSDEGRESVKGVAQGSLVLMEGSNLDHDSKLHASAHVGINCTEL